MPLKTVNKKVACTPFPTRQAELEKRGGMMITKQKMELTCLEVVLNSDSYRSGDNVYVRGEHCVHQWAKEVFEISEKKFILVPEEFVLLHEE